MNYSLYSIEDFLTDESFINYCLNANQNDVSFWENMLIAQPELAVSINQARTLLFLMSVKIDPAVKQQELLKLKSAVEKLEEPAVPLEDHRPKVASLRRKLAWISIAAVLFICIGIFAIVNKKDYRTTLPDYSSQSKNAIIKTGYRERKSVTLPDGSTVIINGLTTLKIADDYNVNNRVLWLNGEANFNVAKDASRPFIVVAGKTATTALGTSFKINNYSRSNQTSVMLTTGKVNVGTVTGTQVINHVVLLPGEMVAVEDAAQNFNKTKFNIQEVENWTNRKLVFSMASLKEIRTTLKDMYGVEIGTKNQPRKPIAFTGEFNNENLITVLDAIGFSNHFTYSIKEDKVMLDFGR